MRTYRTYSEAVDANDHAHRLTLTQQAHEGDVDLQGIAEDARMWLDYLMWSHYEGKYRSNPPTTMTEETPEPVAEVSIDAAYQSELDRRLDGLKYVGERQKVIRQTYKEFFVQDPMDNLEAVDSYYANLVPETREEILRDLPITD